MMESTNYIVSIDNVRDVIESDKVVYVKRTGQTLFYLNEKLMHIAPAKAFISSTEEELEVVKALDQLYNSINYDVRKLETQIKESGLMMDDPAISLKVVRANISQDFLSKLKQISYRFKNRS